MNMTNTLKSVEMTPAGRRTFDKMTRALTAFDTYQELVSAGENGWAVSLDEDDSEAAILGVTLESEGRKVHWRRGRY